MRAPRVRATAASSRRSHGRAHPRRGRRRPNLAFDGRTHRHESAVSPSTASKAVLARQPPARQPPASAGLGPIREAVPRGADSNSNQACIAARGEGGRARGLRRGWVRPPYLSGQGAPAAGHTCRPGSTAGQPLLGLPSSAGHNALVLSPSAS
eukprot:scaffold3793_cov397-Prasinococcus_capsulatus_cf.AAC.2